MGWFKNNNSQNNNEEQYEITYTDSATTDRTKTYTGKSDADAIDKLLEDQMEFGHIPSILDIKKK